MQSMYLYNVKVNRRKSETTLSCCLEALCSVANSGHIGWIQNPFYLHCPPTLSLSLSALFCLRGIFLAFWHFFLINFPLTYIVDLPSVGERAILAIFLRQPFTTTRRPLQPVLELDYDLILRLNCCCYPGISKWDRITGTTHWLTISGEFFDNFFGEYHVFGSWKFFEFHARVILPPPNRKQKVRHKLSQKMWTPTHGIQLTIAQKRRETRSILNI